jgi:ABC-type antimicrobial peptide transport system permease subunit
MGARTMDIFKVFMLEAIMLSILIFIGAFVSIGIAGAIGNAIIQSGAGIALLIFGLNPAVVLLITVVALIVIFASYLLPVFAYARHSTARGLIKNINVKSDN